MRMERRPRGEFLLSAGMCTVTVIALRNGFRLVSNRDEQRSRPPALPPEWREIPTPPSSTLRAVWPADRLRTGSPGGTWIAASDRGLAMSLLNLNLTPPPVLPAALDSRGDIIPSLIHLGSAHAVAAAVHAMDLSRFAPFRLVAAEVPTPDSPPTIAEIRWDRRTVASAWHRAPACFASSGLGDELVQCRLPLFQEMFAQTPADDHLSVQDEFHAHVWPDRPHLSVLMTRADARTVSTTSATVTRDPWTGRASVAMAYTPFAQARPESG